MRVSFGDCVFDSGTRQVFRAGKPIPISPKAFQLLEKLIEKRPNAVSKEELQELLWPSTYVSDGNLPNLVAELRSELGDSPRSSRIIRTVQRFRYAFVATPLSAPPPKAKGHSYRLILGDRDITLGVGENLFGRDEEALVDRRRRRLTKACANLDRRIGCRSGRSRQQNGTYLGGTRIQSVSSRILRTDARSRD